MTHTLDRHPRFDGYRFSLGRELTPWQGFSDDALLGDVELTVAEVNAGTVVDDCLARNHMFTGRRERQCAT
jgi:hypothetical protein